MDAIEEQYMPECIDGNLEHALRLRRRIESLETELAQCRAAGDARRTQYTETRLKSARRLYRLLMR